MNKIPIPTEFEIFGNTLTIELDSQLAEKDNCRGKFLAREDKIVLQTPTKNHRKYDDLVNTFFHEIIHVILDKTQFEVIFNKDPELERFISVLAGCLHQIFKTAKYKDKP